MATVTLAMLAVQYRKRYRKGRGKEEFKTGELVTRTAMLAGLQAVEDRFMADRLNYKVDLDTALGITTTNAQAKQYERMWFDLHQDGSL